MRLNRERMSPPQDALLSQEDKDRFAQWLRDKGIGACPLCGNTGWHVASTLLYGAAADPETLEPPERPEVRGYRPALVAICNNCAFNAHFNVGIILEEEL